MASLAALGGFLAAGTAAAAPTTLAGIGASLAASTATVGAAGTAVGGSGILAGLSTLMTIAGGAVAAVGQIASGQAQAAQARESGRAAAQAAEFEAQQLDIRQKEAQAEGIQKAKQKRLQGAFIKSRFQAQSAGSGFDPTDPTSIQLAGQLEDEIEFQASLERANAFSRGSSFGLAAESRRFSGQSALSAGNLSASALNSGGAFSAFGTLAGAGGTAFDRFSRRKALTTPSGSNRRFD